ncbi:hypothetical protein Tco_0669056 [Tanacetum coccineum]
MGVLLRPTHMAILECGFGINFRRQGKDIVIRRELEVDDFGFVEVVDEQLYEECHLCLQDKELESWGLLKGGGVVISSSFVRNKEMNYLNASEPALLEQNEKERLVSMLKNHKEAFAWKTSDILGISPSFCKYKINFEDDVNQSF